MHNHVLAQRLRAEDDKLMHAQVLAVLAPFATVTTPQRSSSPLPDRTLVRRQRVLQPDVDLMRPRRPTSRLSFTAEGTNANGYLGRRPPPFTSTRVRPSDYADKREFYARSTT